MRPLRSRKRLAWRGWAGLLLLLALTGGCASPKTPPPPSETAPLSTPSSTPAASPLPPTPSPTSRPTETPLPPSPVPSPTPTEPAPQAAASIRFAVIGDYGDGGESEAAVAALVDSWDVDFILTTGDNNYPDGNAATIDEHIGRFYQAYIAPYAGTYGQGAQINRFFPVPGNHDWDTGTLQPYTDYFTLPGNERYYAFTWGPVAFFMLDSDSREPDGVGRSSLQAAWLEEQLAASGAAWNIVVGHHPPYSSGKHGDTAYMRWPFAAWGADAVISGHDHVYERIVRDGIVYFVNGLGGLQRYAFGETTEGSRKRFNAGYGAMLVEADADSLTFRFVTVQGEVVDVWKLVSP